MFADELVCAALAIDLSIAIWPFSRQQTTPSGSKLEGMWIFVAASVVAMFLFVAGRAVIQRGKNRELLLMRDHLNRVSRDWE